MLNQLDKPHELSLKKPSIEAAVICASVADFALTLIIITNAITAVIKYYSKKQSKVLKSDKLQVISLNAGVGVVISVVKEIIKYFSQDMCTNYELHYGID
ncbi:MAG: hypothetical protein MRQ07_02195 [Candidatus Midichloria sp.]|nr:hypothetical protein [Candidatus Midichloria sp.]